VDELREFLKDSAVCSWLVSWKNTINPEKAIPKYVINIDKRIYGYASAERDGYDEDSHSTRKEIPKHNKQRRNTC
jgi:hypothetical protein